MKAIMKTMKNFLSMAALALVGAMMTGCSNDDNYQQPENKNNVVTLTTTIGLDDGGTTRALTATGVKTFAAGDQIAVIYTKNGGTVTKAVSEALPAGSYGANATFTVTLDNPDKTQNVTYIYPAAMAGSTGVDYTKLNSQSSGTLTDLGSKYDLATNSGAWNGDNLPTLTLENQLAILAITLKNSTDITSNITDMTISDGTNTYAVSRSAAAGPIYVAIQPVASQNIEVTATDGTNGYVKTLASKTYAANNGYNVTWNMTKKTITWNSTNVFKVANQDDRVDESNTSNIYEEITISVSGTSGSWFNPYASGEGKALLLCNGIFGDSFTFTAPSGEKFTKIEIIDNSFVIFTAYGDWTQPADEKIVWSGTPANAVTLGGSEITSAYDLNSIVFTLKDE
jgi:hypothetical protein